MTKKQICQDVIVMLQRHILPNYTKDQQRKILVEFDLSKVDDMYIKSNGWIHGFSHEYIINEIVDEYVQRIMGSEYIETEYMEF